jgi:GNAT superfamily N-acetyltransferase
MPAAPRVELRSATVGDAAFIVEMARHACVIEDWPLPDEDSEDTQSLLSPRASAPSRRRRRCVAGIAIAVTPERRGSGIGGSLLDELFVRCTDRHAALSLNVHERNPASHLHERKGFRVLGQGRGTLGIAMRKELRD